MRSLPVATLSERVRAWLVYASPRGAPIRRVCEGRLPGILSGGRIGCGFTAAAKDCKIVNDLEYPASIERAAQGVYGLHSVQDFSAFGSGRRFGLQRAVEGERRDGAFQAWRNNAPRAVRTTPAG